MCRQLWKDKQMESNKKPSLDSVSTYALKAELDKRQAREDELMKSTPPQIENGLVISKEIRALLRETIRLIVSGEEELITDDMAHIITNAVFAAFYGPDFMSWYLKTAKGCQ